MERNRNPMTREIKWHIDRTVSVEKIRELEGLWNVRFPEAYVNIVTKHDGAQPGVINDNNVWKEGIIQIPRWHGKYAGFGFLGYTNADTVERTRVFKAYKVFKDCLPIPEKIFPFAADGGGNLFFFDYRQSDNEPAIVFLDHGEAITEEDIPEEDLAKKPLIEWLNDNLYLVCNSFSELLDLIKLP
jgi:hypothetical protein